MKSTYRHRVINDNDSLDLTVTDQQNEIGLLEGYARQSFKSNLSV